MNDCLRCGQCCFLSDGKEPTNTPCPYLKFICDGLTYCTVYNTRLGRFLGEINGVVNICVMRHANTNFDFEGCPQNSDNPVYRIKNGVVAKLS